jgi:hypothetical protein
VTVAAPSAGTTYYYDLTQGSNTLTFNEAVTMEVFMIGGGAGGGAIHAGGGGAGAYYYTNGTPHSVSSGTTYSVYVGAGGAGGLVPTNAGSATAAVNGQDTYVQNGGSDVFRVRGGGHGAGYNDSPSTGGFA